MKRIKSLLAGLFLAAVCSTSIFAAGLSLDKVCNELAQHPNTTGDFVQTKTIKSTKRALKSSGNFIFSLDGIMWKTVKPFPSTLAVGRTSVIQTAADGKKTVIDASDNQIFASISSTLVAVFSNDVNELSKSFETKFTDKGNNSWELVLTPKDSTVASVLKNLTLSGTSSNGSSSIDSILMTESSENTINYEFSNQKYPQELSADEKANFNAK